MGQEEISRLPSPGGSVSDATLHLQKLERIAPPSMLVDEAHHAIHLSENAGRFLRPPGDPVTTDASDLVREEFRFHLRAALDRAFERNESTLTMPILAKLDGQPHRVYLHVKPVREGGDPARHALVLFIEGEAAEQATEVSPKVFDGHPATSVDVIKCRRAEENARESHQRLEQEVRLVELSRAPIFVWDFDDGITQWNRGSEELYGYSRKEALGKPKEKLLKTVVPGSSFEALRQTLLEKGHWSGELRHTTKGGQVLTVECQVELLPLGGRRLVLEGTRDVTELKRRERRRQLLLGELGHRVKNTLAVVQSLARQTLRTADSNEDFAERFEGRLSALAAAHKLLVESDWRGAELGALALSQLEAYGGTDRQRLRVEGENVMLPPDIATPFGLVLHELATNAAKYGAFATADGQVILTWKLRNTGRHLIVSWRERGGPPVKPPEKQGFGGVLIEKSLPGATVRREFQPDGVLCTIDIELPETPQDDAV